MKPICIVLVILFGLSAIIQVFEESPFAGFAIVIVLVIIIVKAIHAEQAKQEQLSKLSPEELRSLALREHKKKARKDQAQLNIKMDIEKQKKIARLKSYIKLTIGMEVNPDKETIEIDGISFSVENRPHRVMPVLIGQFYCWNCRDNLKIIDELSDYGYLVQKYQEHLNKCPKKI